MNLTKVIRKFMLFDATAQCYGSKVAFARFCPSLIRFLSGCHFHPPANVWKNSILTKMENSPMPSWAAVCLKS